ncbi:MAG TPA: formate dehydrogenase accessory protein FdhE [Polyangia bacterium]|nr:formate dehydrogenase accessory protein FdhE [Polyangia bacterium]
MGAGSAFERRATRAEALARESTPAREPLEFAAGLYRAQQSMASAIEAAAADRPLVGRLDQDLDSFAGATETLLRFATDHGPPALSEAARGYARDDLRARLCAWWNDGGSGGDDYLARALLRPYAEVLGALGLAPGRRPAGANSAACACAFCGGLPWIASRVSSGSSEGAQRFLGCALCGKEWPAGRIRCPACDEERPDKLASFQSDRHPTVRIETCASCRAYVKSIDLTVDARAIPEVDDLLSLSMDLWAADEGYARIEPGLAGI